MVIRKVVRSLVTLATTMTLASCFYAREYVVEHPSHVPYRLNLPNLTCKAMKHEVLGNSVLFKVDIKNAGSRASGPFDVYLWLRLTDNNGQTRAYSLDQVRWGALDAGDSQRREHTPTISITGLARPIAVLGWLEIDTPIRGGGQVRESNEGDNVCIRAGHPENPNVPWEIN